MGRGTLSSGKREGLDVTFDTRKLQLHCDRGRSWIPVRGCRDGGTETYAPSHFRPFTNVSSQWTPFKHLTGDRHLSPRLQVLAGLPRSHQNSSLGARRAAGERGRAVKSSRNARQLDSPKISPLPTPPLSECPRLLQGSDEPDRVGKRTGRQMQQGLLGHSDVELLEALPVTFKPFCDLSTAFLPLPHLS